MKDNSFQKIEKVVVNTGLGRASAQANFGDKILPEIAKEFAMVTGQKPRERRAVKSIAGFKLRAGTVVGLVATLRGKRMEHFIKKLVGTALPRVRDFRGIRKTSVDARGNLTLGVKEHIVFPEIVPELSRADFGLEVTIVPKIEANHEEAIALYKEVGIPFGDDIKEVKIRKKKK